MEKKSKQANKNHQKTIFDVKFFLSPGLCVLFLAGGQCCLPSQHLSPCEFSSTYKAILHPPYHQGGVFPPRRSGGEGAPPLAVAWVVLGLFPWMLRSCLVPSKDKSKVFLVHLGNPELLQSAAWQLVMRSQEV